MSHLCKVNNALMFELIKCCYHNTCKANTKVLEWLIGVAVVMITLNECRRYRYRRLGTERKLGMYVLCGKFWRKIEMGK